MLLRTKSTVFTSASFALCLSLSAACGAPRGGTAAVARSGSASQYEGRVVEVSAGRYEFKPRELKLKAGQPVTIVLKSTGGSHSFDVDALNLHSAEAEGGKSITFQFTPDKPGAYEFYCAHSGHKERGMTGRLEVTP